MNEGPDAARTVLVVDDRLDVRELIAEDLQDSGYRVLLAGDGAEAWRVFRSSKPALVITDLKMPREDGISLLRRIRAVSSVPVLLLTAQGDIPAAVEAIRCGATEFLTFPEELDRALQRVQELLGGEATPHGPAGVEASLPGRSLLIRKARERVLALGPLAVPVLIRGEPGSGKDTVAETIHRLGGGGGDLVRIRPQDPAANDSWSPKLRAAVYLDRVERHPREAQKRWADRLGSEPSPERGGPASFRLLASSEEDLGILAGRGEFDPTLAACLGRFSIVLPPLRDRREDLPDLVRSFVHRISRIVGREDVRTQPGALSRLRDHAWPGNLRELESVLERLVAFSRDGVITRRSVEDVLRESGESLETFRSRRERSEREELIELLAECGGNLAEVARRLDLSRSTVHYRVRKHGLMPRGRRR